MSDVDAALERIRTATREAVDEGDAQDCSSSDCIADAVYEIVRVELAAIRAESTGGLDDLCSPYYERGWKAGAESAGGLDVAEALTAELIGVESSLTQASERLERAIHLAARLTKSAGGLDVERLMRAADIVTETVDITPWTPIWWREVAAEYARLTEAGR